MAEKEIIPTGAVLYTDGSAIPNPGDSGWGLHGFVFNHDEPKKGSGCSTDYITDLGYVLKDLLDQFRKGMEPDEIFEELGIDFSQLKKGTREILEMHLQCKQVTPIEYVDMFGPVGRCHTNNAAEAMGLLRAFEYLLTLPASVKEIMIYADSTYALTGFRDYLDGWARNNWLKRDGSPIKNLETWKRLYDIRDAVYKDRNINLMWNPGHSFFKGNQMADTNADLGRNCTVHAVTTDTTLVRPAQGYWKDDEVDRHPLFAHTKVVFHGDREFHTPGLYHMAAADKDLGVFGKRLSDSAYSIVRTEKPVESVEKMIAMHCELGEDREETVVLSLPALYRPSLNERLHMFGRIAFYHPLSHLNNLISVDKESVTEVVDPPKRAQDAIIALNTLEQVLIDVHDNGNPSGRYVKNDVTSLFYEQVETTKKKEKILVNKLRDSIKPGLSSIKVDLQFKTVDGEDVSLPTILTFGIDLPDRNTYKKIEESKPEILVYTYQESPGVFRYFSVVKAGNDIGAYSGSDSNVRLNKRPK